MCVRFASQIVVSPGSKTIVAGSADPSRVGIVRAYKYPLSGMANMTSPLFLPLISFGMLASNSWLCVCVC